MKQPLIKSIAFAVIALCSLLAVTPDASAQGAFGASAHGSFGAPKEETSPISWRGTARLTGNSEGVITLTATMAQGWHLYGLEMPQDGPRPTSFTFEQAKGWTPVGKTVADRKPNQKHDAMFNADVQFWEGKVVFTQRFKLNKKDGDVETIRCTVNYMGCNDETCLPPKKKEFNLKILPKK